jgi:hypothetical protein
VSAPNRVQFYQLADILLEEIRAMVELSEPKGIK